MAEDKAEMTAETVVEKTQDAACLDQQLISQDFQELGDLMQQGKKGEDASQDLSREAREEAVPSASQTDQKLQNSAVSMLQMWPPLSKAAAPAPLLLQKTVQKIEDVPRASEYDFRNGFSDGRTVSYSVASPAKECSMHASLFTPCKLVHTMAATSKSRVQDFRASLRCTFKLGFPQQYLKL